MSEAELTIAELQLQLKALKKENDLLKLNYENQNQSLQRFEFAVECANDGIWDWDVSSDKVFFSPQWKSMIGYKNDEIGDTFDEFSSRVHPEDLDGALSEVKRHFNGEIDIFKYEIRLACKDKSYKWILTIGKVIKRDKYGNPLRTIGIHRDISDNIIMENALIRSEKKFRSIYDYSNDSILLLDDNGVFDCNKASLSLFGFSSLNRLANKNPSNLSPQLQANGRNSEEMFIEYINKAKEFGSSKFEWIHKRFDNQNLIPAEVILSKLEFDGEVFIQATIRDISERKKSELEISNKNLLLTNLIINVHEGILLEDINRKIVLTNGLFCLMFGIPLSPEMMIGADCSNSAEQSKIFFKNPEKFIYDINTVLEERKAVFNDELALVDGHFYERDYIPTFVDGTYNGHLWKYRDITNRKQIEEKIQEQNERLNTIISALPDLLFVFDREGNYLEYYASESDILFIPDSEIIGQNIKNLFDEESASMHIKHINECIIKQSLVTYIYSFVVNNIKQTFEARMVPFKTNNVLAFVREITENVKKEEVLQKLSQAVEQSPALTYITDLNGVIEYVNPKALSITGYSKEELIGKTPRIFQSGNKTVEDYKQIWDTIKSGIAWKGEFLNKKKNGELHWIMANISPVYNSHNVITHFLAVQEDITIRKDIEEELLNLNSDLELKVNQRTAQIIDAKNKLQNEIEERIKTSVALEEALTRLNKIASRLPGVVYQYLLRADGSSCFPYASSGIKDIYRVNPEDIIDDASIVFTKLHPDDLDGVAASIQASARDLKLWRYEYRVKFENGDIRWLLGNAFPQRLEDNSTLWHGFISDITESKEVENEFIKVSTRLSLAKDISGIGVWDYDFKKNILVWDNWMFDLYGVDKDKFSGDYSFWLSCLHPDDRIDSDNQIQKAVNGEKEFDTEFRVVWPDGSIHYLKALAKVQLDENGTPNSMIGTNWDITELKRARGIENELLQLSIQLTGLDSSKLSGALDMALGRIGSFLGADRAYIFEINSIDYTMNNTYEWCNVGINPEINNLQDIPCGIFPLWMSKLLKQETVDIPFVRKLPKSWQAEKDILEPQGIQSLIVIPILNEDVLIGFVGLDSVKNERIYSTSEKNILKVWSNMLSSLINNQKTKQVLDQTRINFETFFNTIDDFIFILDEQGNMIHVNNTVLERLGYTKEEILGDSVLTVHPEERREEAGRIVGEMLQGTMDMCPVPIITKSGVPIPVETRVKRGFWNGKPAIFGITKDISRIQLSEEKFSKVFYLNPSACGLSDLVTGEYVEVNQAFYKLFEFDKDEVIGKTPNELGITTPEIINTLLNNVDVNGKITDAEVDLKTKYGKTKSVLISGENIFIQDKQYRFTVVNDRTERKKAKEQLIQSEKFVALGKLMANLAHEINTPLGAISASYSTSLDAINYVRNNYNNIDLSSSETRQLIINLIFNNSKNPKNLSTMEEREFKNQLKTKLQDLGLENYNDIAHHLLSFGIVDDFEKFLPLFKDESSENLIDFATKISNLIQSLSIIKTATDRANKVVFALRVYSRIDNTSVALMANVVNGIETILTLYQNLTKHSVIINKEFAFNEEILCYPDELNQVWTNLISNALHAMNYNGTLSITTSKSNNLLLVSIKDTGCGIPRSDFQKIFEPFYTTKSQGEGTGLGLDIISKIIEKHKGWIELESELGIGTEFKIYLPIENNL